MSYLFQILILVFLISCALLSDALWSWTGLINMGGVKSQWYKYVAATAGLVIYSGIDYFLLDYLMLLPGKIYLIA